MEFLALYSVPAISLAAEALALSMGILGGFTCLVIPDFVLSAAGFLLYFGIDCVLTDTVSCLDSPKGREVGVEYCLIIMRKLNHAYQLLSIYKSIYWLPKYTLFCGLAGSLICRSKCNVWRSGSCIIYPLSARSLTLVPDC